jgi:shikimate dehydrogenase
MAFRENEYVKSMMVSNPFKEQIIPYVDGIDRVSQRAGAINLILKHKMILTGVNIDGEAFLGAMEREGVNLEGKNICFLGAGGVSAAVSTAIAPKCRSIALIDVDQEKAVKLKARLDQLMPPGAGPVRILPSYDGRDLSSFDIIYNGTGLGKRSQADSDLSASPLNEHDLLPSEGTAIDAVYTPEKTQFLSQCEKDGMRIINGLSHMLACTSIHLKITTDIPITYEQVEIAHRELFQEQL